MKNICFPVATSNLRKSHISVSLCLFLICSVSAYGQEHDFEYIGNHIYLATEINGKPAKLVFDTGAELVYLDSAFVSDNGLSFKRIGNAVIDGIGTDGPGKTKIILGEVLVSLGGNVYKPDYTPLINLKPLLGEQADGIFGMKAILGKIISIDWKNGKFNLYDKLEPHMTHGWHCVPVKFQSRQILVPLKVTVNTQTIISGDALMDIGSGSGIIFTSPVASGHSLENIEKKEQFKTGGLGGKSAGYTIHVEGADINGIPIDLESARYSTDLNGSLATSRYVANVGNAVWSQFDIILDLTNEKMYLRKN